METFAQLNARKPTCDCEEYHVEDCPVPQWEMDYWAHYFGQDYGTKEERKQRLMAMDPRKIKECGCPTSDPYCPHTEE